MWCVCMVEHYPNNDTFSEKKCVCEFVSYSSRGSIVASPFHQLKIIIYM